jgi:hypothetical protein
MGRWPEADTNALQTKSQGGLADADKFTFTRQPPWPAQLELANPSHSRDCANGPLRFAAPAQISIRLAQPIRRNPFHFATHEVQVEPATSTWYPPSQLSLVVA